jgi:polysaccharide export outer membrane protein
LNREVVIPPDGIISYPLINDIDASGMTVTKLRNSLAERLSEYIPDVEVTVMIKEINSLKAYVIGKVNNPGEFNISMNTSVMQILAMAKGFNPFASVEKIQILRQKKKIVVKIPFNYKQVERGENLSQIIILQRGDVVIVP